jgi:hypothetical protein
MPAASPPGRAVHFEKPVGWAFKAGQFIDMTLLNPSQTDPEGNKRGFSIASAPQEETLMVANRSISAGDPARLKMVLRHCADGLLSHKEPHNASGTLEAASFAHTTSSPTSKSFRTKRKSYIPILPKVKPDAERKPSARPG